MDRFLFSFVFGFILICLGTILSSCKKDVGATPTNPSSGFVIDIDGNVYQTVTIGTQVWMKENLKVTKYLNGDPIPTNLTDGQWGSTTSGAYAVYNNDTANNRVYGKLYNWYAVRDWRNLCPSGWHIPSDAEWTVLENFLGGSAVAGGKLKSTSSLWIYPNAGATDQSGFSGLPGGCRISSGPYNYFGFGFWWSFSEGSKASGWLRLLDFNNVGFYRGTDSKQIGYSIRCIKD